jgi:hypothetical protein
MERMTLEKVAAIKVRMAADAMQVAAYDLRALRTLPAIAKAVQMMGAARMARQWARELSKLHRQRQGTCRYPDCSCPFDAPADPNWCARGLPKMPNAKHERTPD